MTTRLRLSLGLFVLISTVVGATLLGSHLKSRRPVSAIPSNPAPSLSCGYWAVYRACELCGVPLSLTQLRREMAPPHPTRGLRFQDLADFLTKVGLVCKGYRMTLESLASRPGVHIAHLQNPDHFVTVSRVEGSFVYFFDQMGQRRILSVPNFRSRWSGNVLAITCPKPEDSVRTSACDGPPRIKFNTLVLDTGDIRVDPSNPFYSFDFPFVNRGGNELRIGKINTTCACLQASSPDEAIPPGGRGVVRLNYRLDPDTRQFAHHAFVESNDPVHPWIALRIVGNANLNVSVIPNSLNLGNVVVGQEVVSELIFRSPELDALSVRCAGSSSDRLSTHRLSTSETSKPSPRLTAWSYYSTGGVVIQVRYQAPQGVTGEIRETLTIQTNIPGYESIIVPVTGKVVLPVTAYPPMLYFGEPSAREVVSRSMLLIASNEQPLRVIGLRAAPVGMTVTTTAVPNQPDRARVTFTSPGAVVLGQTGKSLTLQVEVNGSIVDLDITVQASTGTGR